jgi:hypothetical protein
MIVCKSWCMTLARPRAKVRSVERRSMESANDGVECRAGRVLRAAVSRLMECPVKLQSARSMLGSMAGLSSVTAGCWSLDVYSFTYWQRMNGIECRLRISAFLYTGPPLVLLLCHWLVSQVGRRGLLDVVWGDEGHLCRSVVIELGPWNGLLVYLWGVPTLEIRNAFLIGQHCLLFSVSVSG